MLSQWANSISRTPSLAHLPSVTSGRDMTASLSATRRPPTARSPPPVRTHNGGNMAQQLRRLSLSVIQADAVGLVKMRSVLDDGDGQFPFFNRIFSVLLMDLRQGKGIV